MTRPEPAMTADAFLAWAMEQEQGRFELVHGQVVAMPPERAGHARAKARAHRALEDAIALAGLGCEAFADGMAVRIDAATVYEPDALVRCGPPLPDDAIELSDPVIVVEVVSPPGPGASRGIDSGAKLAGYFRLPSLVHYLVIDSVARTVSHHRRDEGGEIRVRILEAGALALDPPGLAVPLADLFVPA